MSDDMSMGLPSSAGEHGYYAHAGGCNELPGSQQDAAYLQYCLVGQ